jgi:uncharacterized membrane protein YccC
MREAIASRALRAFPDMKSKMPTWLPDPWDMVFSLKTFAAAMLALFIALCFDLPNPYWAVTTVYIVAHPLSGASTSKAVYRLVGTVVGGTMSIIMVPNLVNAPELLTLAVALWVGGCLALSLLDRTPRSYCFMLAGYTAALTSFPVVDAPSTIFTYATSRMIEIAVAIICAALINRIVFPRHAGPVLASRINAWLHDASAVAIAALEGRAGDPALVTMPRRLAAEAADIRMFTTHVSYDTSAHSALVDRSRELQGLMITVLPIVSGLADVQAALSKSGYQMTAAVQSLIEDAAGWLRRAEPPSEDQRARLLSSLSDVETQASMSRDWQDLLLLDLTTQLRDLLQIWADCVSLRQEIASGAAQPRSVRSSRFSMTHTLPIHRDYGMALFSGFSAMLAIVLGTIFWIATGWSSGAGAPLIAGILICFFATMDNPTPIILKFMKFSLVAMILSFIFVFAVMPVLDGFVSLALALSFLFLPLGLLIAKPSTFLLGMALSANIPTMLTLQSRPVFDLASFLNTNIATVLGTVMAIGIAAVVRSVGAEWSARRLLRAGWVDVAGAARRSQGADLQVLLHKMMDRLSLLVPRLGAIPQDSPTLRADLLKDTRVGMNVIRLQQLKGLLRGDAREAVDAVLDAIGRHYHEKQRHTEIEPGPELFAALDKSMDIVCSPKNAPSSTAPRLVLVSLRHTLFPNAAGPEPREPEIGRQAAE